MKLKDYLNSYNFFDDDHITITNIEILFKNICEKYDNYIFTYGELEKFINSDKKITILSINPDSDIPKPKDYVISEYNNPYLMFDEEKQKMIDEIDYFEKIELDMLNNINDNIENIYCNSVGKLHSKINMVPIGRDFKNVDFFEYADQLCKNKKTILCYYNVTLPPKNFHWYGLIREHIYNLVKDKDFIKKKKCQQHPRVYTHVDIVEYYDDLSKSKFMICPRGCGIDTYRFWDSIYMGCIPIVEKYEGYNQFDDLPILFINNWKEIENISPDYLESKWKEMIEREYNYDKLRMSYWKNKILNQNTL